MFHFTFNSFNSAGTSTALLPTKCNLLRAIIRRRRGSEKSLCSLLSQHCLIHRHPHGGIRLLLQREIELCQCLFKCLRNLLCLIKLWFLLSTKKSRSWDIAAQIWIGYLRNCIVFFLKILFKLLNRSICHCYVVIDHYIEFMLVNCTYLLCFYSLFHTSSKSICFILSSNYNTCIMLLLSTYQLILSHCVSYW